MDYLTELNSNTNINIVPNEKRGEIAFALEQRVKELQRNIGYNFLEMGKVLKEIRDNQYYRELGYDTITDWLQERSISPGWAWNFINIYETFILKHGLSPERVLATDYNKLSMILPIVKRHPEQVDDWLTKAENLRRIDLKREILEFKQENYPEEVHPLKQSIYISLTSLFEILHYLIAIERLYQRKEDVEAQLLHLKDYLIGLIKQTSGIEDETKYLDNERIRQIEGERKQIK